MVVTHDSCGLSWKCWELNLCYLREQHVPLTAEPSPQLLVVFVCTGRYGCVGGMCMYTCSNVCGNAKMVYVHVSTLYTLKVYNLITAINF